MAKKKSTDDSVGYGKPPKANRFPKGKSGNSKGRPKGTKNLRTILQAALNSKVTIRDGDGTRTVIGLEALVHGLLVKGIKGDSNAALKIIKLVQEFEAASKSNQVTPPEARGRSGVLVVPPLLDTEDWEVIFSASEEVQEAFYRMFQKGQIVAGVDVKLPFRANSGG